MAKKTPTKTCFERSQLKKKFTPLEMLQTLLQDEELIIDVAHVMQLVVCFRNQQHELMSPRHCSDSGSRLHVVNEHVWSFTAPAFVEKSVYLNN